jgi:hypothetical protein
VEVHFTQTTPRCPGKAFVHVTDALKLWKHLRNRDTAGVGPIADQEYGLTDPNPDGNNVRFGSPTV